jgi:hypothetical protein
VQEDAREVVAERVTAPDRRVEHERRQVDGPVEVEHVAGEHPEREHVEPVPRVVEERIGEDLQPGVVDELRGERGHEDRERDGGQDHGGALVHGRPRGVRSDGRDCRPSVARRQHAARCARSHPRRVIGRSGGRSPPNPRGSADRGFRPVGGEG